MGVALTLKPEKCSGDCRMEQYDRPCRHIGVGCEIVVGSVQEISFESNAHKSLLIWYQTILRFDNRNVGTSVLFYMVTKLKQGPPPCAIAAESSRTFHYFMEAEFVIL